MIITLFPHPLHFAVTLFFFYVHSYRSDDQLEPWNFSIYFCHETTNIIPNLKNHKFPYLFLNHEMSYIINNKRLKDEVANL